MPKIYWIDKPIKFKYWDCGREHESSIGPGWFYSKEPEEDDGEFWGTPFENMKRNAPHIEISVGDKLLTRNGSIMKVGPWGISSTNRPQEAHFWFFKDAVAGTYHDPNNEGTLGYYDKYLNHVSGNHIDKFSGYDIVSLYDDTKDKCPCCNRRFDGRKD